MQQEPLRILVVSMWPSPAAPERGIFVQRQVEALERLGHEVHVAPLRDVATGRLRTPLKYARLAAAGWVAGRRWRPDVVHGHYLMPTGSVARMVAQRLGVPYVVTAHGTDVRNAEQSPRLRVRTWPVVRDAAAVIAVSTRLAQRLQAVFPHLDPPPHVIDMGVDTRTFRPAPGGTASVAEHAADPRTVRAPRLIAVGSLLPNKNHERLLAAVAQIDGARLTCIGEGPQRAVLERRIAELGLEGRVRLAGRVPHPELPAWYHGADVACLVSLDEGFGLAGLEALACGCPLVVSRTAPVSELVEHGTTGAVVDPLDADDIAAGILVAATRAPLPGELVRRATSRRSTDERAAELGRVLAQVAEHARG